MSGGTRILTFAAKDHAARVAWARALWARGYSVDDVAESVGTTGSTVSRWKAHDRSTEQDWAAAREQERTRDPFELVRAIEGRRLDVIENAGADVQQVCNELRMLGRALDAELERLAPGPFERAAQSLRTLQMYAPEEKRAELEAAFDACIPGLWVAAKRRALPYPRRRTWMVKHEQVRRRLLAALRAGKGDESGEGRE